MTEIVEGANKLLKAYTGSEYRDAATIEELITDKQIKQILLKMYTSSLDPKKK